MEGIHETKLHGRRSFPFIVYRGNLPEYDRFYPLHWHDEMEIISISSGCGSITVQSETFTAQPGDLLLVPPQVLHGIDQLENQPMEYYNILFRFSLLESNPMDTCYEKYLRPIYEGGRFLPFYLPSGDPLNQLLQPYVESLIAHRRESLDGYELLVKSNLFAILHHLNQSGTAATSAQYALQSTYDKLKQVLVHLQVHYASPITVEQAAGLCGFSPSHFMKLFRQLTGSSFTQYLKQYRLEIAASQLVQTDHKIAHIARRTGFQNLSYFTRSFAEQYGLPPAAYRKNHKA